MILTPLIAVFAFAVQGRRNSPPVAPPPAPLQALIRIKVMVVPAKLIYDEVVAAKPAGLSFIATDPADNAVVVRGKDAAVQRVRDIVARLDIGVPRLIKRVMVKNLDVKAVYKMLADKPMPAVDFFSYDPTTNEIVAHGTEDGLAKLVKKISDLDTIVPE